MAKKKTTKDKEVKTSELPSEVVTICNEYNLTPAMRKGIEAILASEPFVSQEEISQVVGVRRETVNRWMHTRSFLNAMAEAANIIIDQAWPHILQSGILRAKEGDVQWAKWLGEVSGRWHHKAMLEHRGKVEQEHSGEISIDGYDREEIAEIIGELRTIKARRTRARTLN